MSKLIPQHKLDAVQGATRFSEGVAVEKVSGGFDSLRAGFTRGGMSSNKLPAGTLRRL